jgi:hypothetical protein
LVEAVFYKPEGSGFGARAPELGVYSASKRNDYEKQGKKFWGSRARSPLKADNLTAFCEAVVWTMWDPQHLTTV